MDLRGCSSEILVQNLTSKDYLYNSLPKKEATLLGKKVTSFTVNRNPSEYIGYNTSFGKQQFASSVLPTERMEIHPYIS